MRRQDWFFLLALCLVVLCEAVASQQQSPTVYLRPRAAASQPGVPQVRVTVDRPRVPLGTPVTFSLTPASIVNDRRYVVTLYFGNGQKQVMQSPQVVYVYRAVGTYTYAVDVKPPPSPQCSASATLSASPSSVPQNEPVKFSAQPSGNCPNVQYRFVFGDGSSSGWQVSPQAQHNYARAGTFWPYVDISDTKSRIGGSKRIRVDVNPTAPDKVSVSLTTRPVRARSGRPVTFIANASPARANARYQFNFGDGSQVSSQTGPRAQHIYKSPGRYTASVQVTQFANNQQVSATSAPAVLTVRSGSDPTPDPSPGPSPNPSVSPTPGNSSSPTPDGSPTSSGSPGAGGSPTGNGSPSPNASPSGSNGNGSSSPTASDTPTLPGITSAGSKWWYLLIAAVILFLVYQASGYLFAAKPTFAPFADPGVAAVAHGKGAMPINFELVLDPNVSGGDYSVSTDEPRLVTNAPDAEDRQTFEI